MKKLGKRLSFLTKMMLVVGLLISNLSSLSVVFAYEVSEAITINLVDDNLKISYSDNLAEDVESVKVKVYETYTYLNGFTEDAIVNSYTLDETQMASAIEGNLELECESIFASLVGEDEEVEDYKLFDGTYNVRVEIIKVTTLINSDNTENVLELEETIQENDLSEDETQDLAEIVEEVIVTGAYEKEITHKSGLNVKVFDANGEEISKVDGKYVVTKENSNIKVVAQILSGKLSPTDVFVYNEQEFFAKSLLEQEFSSMKNFDGYLYGDYSLPLEIKVLKQLNLNSNNEEVVLTTEEESSIESISNEEQYEEVVYEDNLSIMYGSYELNAAVLNEVLVHQELDNTYKFYNESKDGILYVYLDLVNNQEKTIMPKTMLDLYNVVNSLYGESELVSYQLLKGELNVLDGYIENETQTLEEYLSSIEIDESVLVSLVCDTLNITYKVVIVADFNNDGLIDDNDLLNIIDQVIESADVNGEKADFNNDDKVDSLDVLYLNQIIKTQIWNVQTSEEDAILDASLNVLVDSENELISGDEFTLEYVLSLSENEVSGFAGMLEYDKESLELLSAHVISDWVGNFNKENGKFIYLGDESLIGPQESNENDLEQTTLTEEETTVLTEDYVVLSVKFKALKSGAHEIKINNTEYFNGATYLNLEEALVPTTTVVVEKSDDNSLSYLEVAGQVIDLVQGIFEYELNVSNDVTLVDLKYALSNLAAEVTSTVYPEELVEGNNTIVVTVTSESGVSQDYTITVIREESKKEEVVVQVDDNYYGDYETEEEEVIVTPPEEEIPNDDDDKIEEESNLSKIVIVILILLVIAGLVYLIFKDDDETKKANKAVNKLKNESLDEVSKTATITKTTNKPKVDSSNNNKKKTNNNKKER